jgi:glyoxylase-like metal-dependent hydrolase (beta-lactamase superfamily II)
MDYKPVIHRYEATLGGFLVNAFLIETSSSVIAIDATLAISSTNDLRALLQDKIKKPLKAVLLTHGHPDHYTGVSELIKGYGDVPVIATRQCAEQCRARDEEESGYLGGDQAFGPQYPRTRVFPNTFLVDGDRYQCDGVTLQLCHLGPCESDDDSLWLMNDGTQEHVFSGDVVYNNMHTFFRDGHYLSWMRQLTACIERFDETTVFHTGHGEDMGIELFHWQRAYNQAFTDLLKRMLRGRDTLDEQEQNVLFGKMQRFLPNDKLLMLTRWQFDDMVKVLRRDRVV